MEENMKISILETNLKTKNEILDFLSKQAVKDGVATNVKKLYKALLAREKEFSTGFENGIAIPHARISSIVKPIIYVLRNKTDVNWKSLDGKKTSLAITLLLPLSDKIGTKQMDILRKISTYLVNNPDGKVFKQGTEEMIQKIFSSEDKASDKEKISENLNNNDGQYDFIGITSCPTGVAHTNMAAESFERYAREHNLKVKIERQGAQGIVNRLTENDVKKTKLVIIATGRVIDEKERFVGKRVLEVGVAEPIKNCDKLYKNALANAKIMKNPGRRTTLKQAFGSGGATFMQALMNGVSYMIPFVIVGGIFLAVSLGIGGSVSAKGGGLVIPKDSFWYAINKIGSVGFTLMIAILGGFIASAIGGRAALAPAMIVSFAVGNPLDAINSNSGSVFFNYQTLGFGGFDHNAALGFLGSIAAGLLIGYAVKLWNVLVSPHIHKNIKPIEPIIIIPILMVLAAWALFAFVLYLPLYWTSYGLNVGIKYLIAKNLFFIAALILGGMIAFDMGGPINKIAFLLGASLITSGQPQVMGCIAAAIAVPPLGTGLAVVTRKLWRIKTYDKEDEGNAVSAIFMSLVGITEGAIPFAVKYPKQVIISNVIGGAIGAAVAALFQISDNAAHGGFIVYIVGAIGKNGLSNYLWGLFFVMSIIIGALVTATVMTLLIKYSEIKHKKTSNNEKDGATVKKVPNFLVKMKQRNKKNNSTVKNGKAVTNGKAVKKTSNILSKLKQRNKKNNSIVKNGKTVTNGKAVKKISNILSKLKQRNKK